LINWYWRPFCVCRSTLSRRRCLAIPFPRGWVGMWMMPRGIYCGNIGRFGRLRSA
jgi:hypothetical protein